MLAYINQTQEDERGKTEEEEVEPMRMYVEILLKLKNCMGYNAQ